MWVNQWFEALGKWITHLKKEGIRMWPWHRLLYVVIGIRLVLELRKLQESKHRCLRCDKDGELQAPKTHGIYRQLIQGRHGMWLYTKRWLPPSSEPIRAIVFLVPGLGDYILRYEHVAEAFVRRGFAVFGMDHEGHGLSEGDRLFVEKFDDFVSDYLNFIIEVLEEANPSDKSRGKATLKKLPRFILGHSMGGTITIRTVMESKKRQLTWDGCLLSGAALIPDPQVASPLTIQLSFLLSKILPKAPVAYLDGKGISRNPLVVARYKRDPLIPKTGVTARLAAEILNTMAIIFSQVEDFDTNLFVSHGMEDKVTVPQGSIDFYNKCKSADKTLKVYPDLFHEILNSDSRDDIIHDMSCWIEAKL